MNKPIDWREEAIQDECDSKVIAGQQFFFGFVIGILVCLSLFLFIHEIKVTLTDAEVQHLYEQGITEGDYVPGEGILLPDGTFKK